LFCLESGAIAPLTGISGFGRASARQKFSRSGDFSQTDLLKLTRPADGVAMPKIYWKLERIAFSLVVLLALACFGFIVWQKNPDMTLAIQTGREMLMPNSEHLLACMAPDQGACERMLIELKTPDQS
jgi:hypothetical protein